ACGDHHLLLDSLRRLAVSRGAVRLEGEEHPFTELDGMLEGVEPGDDRPLVQAETESVAELQPKRGHLALEPEVLRLRPQFGDLIGPGPRAHQLDGRVDPLASARVGIALCGSRATHGERAVVARAIPVEGLDDVEVRLVAGTDQPIREIVRMRVAALTRDGVDRLDIV